MENNPPSHSISHVNEIVIEKSLFDFDLWLFHYFRFVFIQSISILCAYHEKKFTWIFICSNKKFDCNDSWSSWNWILLKLCISFLYIEKYFNLQLFSYNTKFINVTDWIEKNTSPIWTHRFPFTYNFLKDSPLKNSSWMFEDAKNNKQ